MTKRQKNILRDLFERNWLFQHSYMIAGITATEYQAASDQWLLWLREYADKGYITT